MKSKPQFTNGPEHEPKKKLDPTTFVPYWDNGPTLPRRR